MRDLSLDNLKFILIALVVVGHTIEPLMGKYDWLKPIYIYIYLFHMPMFAYVSGVMSSKKLDDVMVYNLVGRLIIPYVSLELAYSVFDFYIFSRDSFAISPLVPYWILWYLFSLILWRVLLPVFAQFKYPIMLSLLAGFASGVNDYGYNLSFSRTFVFFPFFLVGHYKHSIIMRKIKENSVSRLIGFSIMALIFIAVSVAFDSKGFDVRWLYGSWSYSSLGSDWIQGVVIRGYIYILAIILGLSLLTMVQKEKYFYTKYGKDSLYVYVSHGFVMKGMLALGVYSYIDSGWQVIVLILVSLILLPILSSHYSKLIADNIMNPLGKLSNNGVAGLLLVKKLHR